MTVKKRGRPRVWYENGDATRIGKIICKRREAMDLNAQDFADKADVTVSSLMRWEQGAVVPRSDNLRKVARAVGMTIKDFW